MVMIVGPTADAVATRPNLRGRDDIERLVVDFYRDAAMDDLLGPVFAAAHVDWPIHIETLTEFWAWQLLGAGDYTGNQLRAHEPVHDRSPLTAAHFERWLDLFTSTIDERFSGPTAEMAKGRATKMASAMRRLLDGSHGVPGEPTAPMWTSGRGRATFVERCPAGDAAM